MPNPNPELIARWEPCEPKTGVKVIVDERKIGTGKVYVGCALAMMVGASVQPCDLVVRHIGYEDHLADR